MAKRKTVLLVDDDRHCREGLRDALAYGGYAVETASDGWQAIERIMNHHFRVAIIDLDLPRRHGVSVSPWDLVALLRNNSPTTAVILVSAEDDPALRARGERFRVTEILEKPISPGHVRAIVGRLDI